METQKLNQTLKITKYDKKAVGIFSDKYYFKLKAYVQRRFGKLIDSQDATQAVFEKLMSLEGTYEVRYPITWLYRVADHHIIDLLRVKRPEEVTLLETQAADFDIEDTIIAGDVKDAILQLDELSQKILYLHYWEDYKFDEIAELLNISSVNARAKASRAYKELKKLLKDL